MFQIERTRQNVRKTAKKMEINHLPDKELKVMVTKILTRLERTVDELRKDINKETEKRKNQSELKNGSVI